MGFFEMSWEVSMVRLRSARCTVEVVAMLPYRHGKARVSIMKQVLQEYERDEIRR